MPAISNICFIKSYIISHFHYTLLPFKRRNLTRDGLLCPDILDMIQQETKAIAS